LIAIWKAGVDAVRSDHLIQQNVQVVGETLRVGSLAFRLDDIDRIHVVGGGKASAGMAQGLEKALGSEVLAAKRVDGWINVPEDCIVPTAAIHLHPARPAGLNEPTQAATEGTAEMLKQIATLGTRDLCIALVSGGGSALMPAPVTGVSLEDKIGITRLLSSRGANIHQLNTVRKQLSRIKGGGLRDACSAGKLVTLIISDVLGDPLDVIASGPTVDDPGTPQDAIAVLKQFATESNDVPDSIWDYLTRGAKRDESHISKAPNDTAEAPVTHNLVLGNIRVAMEAAGQAAEQLGYCVKAAEINPQEPTAEVVGQEIARQAMRSVTRPTCWLSGGEPVVELADESIRGKGGRNQQLVLAALKLLTDQTGANRNYSNLNPFYGMGILSGGTDGEDGPTDAAGALLTADMIWTLTSGFDFQSFLDQNDAYNFLGPLGSLIRTGPTHTNVCDLRVVLSHPS
jgi:hydroxypyruvate reductase